MFGISLIFPTSSLGTFKGAISLCVMFVVNAFFIYSKIYRVLLLQSLNYPLALLSSEVILNTVILIHRFCLCRKLNEFKKITKIISSFRLKEERVICLYAWIAFSTMSYVLKFINFVDINEKDKYMSKLFRMSRNSTALHNVAVISYAFNVAIVMELPLNTFAVFFVITSHDVKCVLKTFLKKICSEYIDNPQKLLRSFNSLKITIDFLDNELSFFVFCAILFSSCCLFFTVTLIIRSENGQSLTFLTIISFVYQFITILGIFVIITTSSCAVSEAYAEVWSQLKTLIVNLDVDFAQRQQHFFLYIEKEAHFTLWKIMPINRSFILGTFGAIITYVLLLDNLISIKIH